MKLDIMTVCGPISVTGVDEEAAQAFLEDYEDGEDRVLSIPDGDPDVTRLWDRESVRGVTAGPDDPAVPEVPEGDAEGVDAPEGSSAA